MSILASLNQACSLGTCAATLCRDQHDLAGKTQTLQIKYSHGRLVVLRTTGNGNEKGREGQWGRARGGGVQHAISRDDNQPVTMTKLGGTPPDMSISTSPMFCVVFGALSVTACSCCRKPWCT